MVPDAQPDRPLSGTGLLTILAVSLLIFPKLALGLSGFETGVAVMALVKGRADDDPKEPTGRIANTRKLLVTAAVIMSVYLLGSSVVVSTLSSARTPDEGGRGRERERKTCTDKELKAEGPRRRWRTWRTARTPARTASR